MKKITRYLHQFTLLTTLLTAILSTSQNAFSHPGYYGTAFHAHTVSQAISIAKQEHKLIFIYAGADDRGWRHFRWPSGNTSELIDLLVRESVIVELNHIKNQDQLAQYSLSKPQILILDENAKLIKKLDANAVANQVEHVIQNLVASDSGIARIQKAVATGNNPFFNQERLAAALAMAQRYQEAIKAYDQSLTDAINEVSLAAKSRRPHVVGALQKLVAKDTSAMEVIKRNREHAQTVLFSHPDNAKLASTIARLDTIASDKQSTLTLFDKMPANSRARNGLFDHVSQELLQQKRYKDILALVDPVAAIKGEIALYQRNKITKPVSADRGNYRGSRQFVITRGVTLIEALAGVNRDTDCNTLIHQITEFDNSTSTHALLSSALQRAGRSDLIQ